MTMVSSDGVPQAEAASRLNAIKTLFNFASRDPEHDRTAVRAHRRVRRGAQLFEDVMHLVERERIVGLHRRMTRRGRGDLLEGVFKAQPATVTATSPIVSR